MCDYTDKSLVLVGSTYAHKEEIKKAGGKYNPNLSVGKGWVFPKTKKKVVEKLVKKMRSAPAKSSKRPKRLKSSKKPGKKPKKSKFKFSACAKFSCDAPFLCSAASKAIGWEGYHNVYDVRMDGDDLVAKRCGNDNPNARPEKLFPNYMPGGKYKVVSNEANGRYISLSNPGQSSGIEVKLWMTGKGPPGGSGCKGCTGNDCSQLDLRYPHKPPCQKSARVSPGLELLGAERVGRVDRSVGKMRALISTYEGVLPVVRGWGTIDATVRKKLGPKKWLQMIHKFNCMIGKEGNKKMNMLACQVWTLKNLWEVYEESKKGISKQKALLKKIRGKEMSEKNVKAGDEKIANYEKQMGDIKKMMKIIVGPGPGDTNSEYYASHEAEYDELSARLDALTGKPTFGGLMQRLKNLST